MITTAPPPKRDYLSYSAVRTFQGCPLKYRFRYIDGLPEVQGIEAQDSICVGAFSQCQRGCFCCEVGDREFLARFFPEFFNVLHGGIHVESHASINRGIVGRLPCSKSHFSKRGDVAFLYQLNIRHLYSTFVGPL